MNTDNQAINAVVEPFTFNLIQPYSSSETSDSDTRFVISGLFREGGLSSLVAKPKQGKSSISRYAAVCVAKGAPFLGRDTRRGESLIISIEDPVQHVNTCLRALEYDPGTDARIILIDRVSRSFSDNIAALRTVLEEHPEIAFVVIDTLAKFVLVQDFNDYATWFPILEEFRQLGRDFPRVSIVCLLHCKKAQGDDPFDSVLGSSALRAEFDTNAAICQESGQRLFVSESRIGKAFKPSMLLAEIIQSGETEVVQKFSLGRPFDQWRSEQKSRSETKRKASLEERIITYLSEHDERSLYRTVIEEVDGKDERKIEAINRLIEQQVIIPSGTKGGQHDPYTLTLNREKLAMHDFMNRFDGNRRVN